MIICVFLASRRFLVDLRDVQMESVAIGNGIRQIDDLLKNILLFSPILALNTFFRIFFIF